MDYKLKYVPSTQIPGASYSLDRSSVRVAPGKSAKVNVTLRIDPRKFSKTMDPTMERTQSGLAQAVEVLEGIEGLEMVRFDSSDVVRHSLVSAIVDAYDAARGPAERSQKRGGARRGR